MDIELLQRIVHGMVIVNIIAYPDSNEPMRGHMKDHNSYAYRSFISLHIKLRKVADHCRDRQKRMDALSLLLGRDIKTSLQLSVAEVSVIVKVLDDEAIAKLKELVLE